MKYHLQMSITGRPNSLGRLARTGANNAVVAAISSSTTFLLIEARLGAHVV
jgi:hypothetical protein